MKNKLYYSIIILTLIMVVGSLLWARGYDKRDHYKDRDYEEIWGYDDDRRDKRSRGDNSFFSGFELLDENQDGEITREEAETTAKKTFEGIDADGSETLSEEEFITHAQDRAVKIAELHYQQPSEKRLERIQERSEKAFSRMDEDENGELDIEEFYQRRLNTSFDRMDRDGNGIIERGEMRRGW